MSKPNNAIPFLPASLEVITACIMAEQVQVDECDQPLPAKPARERRRTSKREYTDRHVDRRVFAACDE